MRLRDRLLACETCEFITELTVDFGENQYSFILACKAKSDCSVDFSVVSPESIAGISGRIDDRSGTLFFDETVLAFPLIADGDIAPVTAPWLLWKSLLGGYIRCAGQDGQQCRITIDDTFNGENLQVDVWLSDEGIPVRAEICWQNKRILHFEITEFRIL